MPQTDTPFKLLVSEFALDFVVWLLNVSDADVRHVQPLKVELPAGAVRIDTVFRVTLADGRVTLLHIEFQGRRSERPMPLRMLDYISRLAQQEQGQPGGRGASNLCSAVLYVGDGAGIDDQGTHQIDCHDHGLTLAWRYRVIRLWQMPAEELLALDRPALLTLIGQTRIEEPGRVLPQALKIIGQTPDVKERSRLFAALTSLVRDEEILKMAEKLAEAMDRGLMMDTPLLRRIREEGQVEGQAKGRAEGLLEAILDVIAARLDPSVPVYRGLERRLSTISDVERLRGLLQAAIQASDVADFERALD